MNGVEWLVRWFFVFCFFVSFGFIVGINIYVNNPYLLIPLLLWFGVYWFMMPTNRMIYDFLKKKYEGDKE
jgi:hypothetical protein